jgi:hypothetical protein
LRGQGGSAWTFLPSVVVSFLQNCGGKYENDRNLLDIFSLFGYIIIKKEGGKRFFRLLLGFFPQKSLWFSNAEQHKSYKKKEKALKAGANIQFHLDFIHVTKRNS